MTVSLSTQAKPAVKKLPYDHPARFVTMGSYYNTEAWVFAPHGDFASRYAQYMYNPPITTVPSDKTNTASYVNKNSLTIPEDLDPWWYAFELLKLDPILVVWDLKDVDVMTVHRYGYFHLDIPNRKLNWVSAENPKGIFSHVYLNRRGPFLPLRLPTQHPVGRTSIWESEPEARIEPTIMEDAIMGIEDDLKEGGEARLPKNAPVLYSILPTRDVDWSGTLKRWLSFIRDEDSFMQFKRHRLYSSRLRHEFCFATEEEFEALDVWLKRDILLLPPIIIDADGMLYNYAAERARIIRSKNWEELKAHYKTIRDRMSKLFGPKSPVEMFVGSYDFEGDDLF